MTPPRFLPRWIWANAWSELAGLGGTGFLYWLLQQAEGERPDLPLLLLSALAAVAAGALLEGALVGYAQARVLATLLPGLPRGSWMRATALGAGLAWALGMIPSTLIRLSASIAPPAPPAPHAAAPPPLFDSPAVYLLAAAMGLVLGPILGIPQWRVLRRQVPRSGAWVGANALAWAAGMPVIFFGAGLPSVGSPPEEVAAIIAVTCLVAGGVVGAVHGPILRRLVRRS